MKNEMAKVCSIEEVRNVYRILVGQPVEENTWKT
jgi:hypothetical protein